MIVSIHQPNYLPYLGFFDKIRRSDIFIVHDDCQFTDSEYQHRNRIRIYSGWKWLTIPVYKEKKAIKDIKIKNERVKNRPHWSKMHYREIEANYAKTPYFRCYKRQIKAIYDRQHEKLIELNMELIEFLLKVFEIDVEIRYASEFGFTSKKTQKIIDLVNAVGGDVYISGAGGRNYLDFSLIKDFEVTFQEFKHPIYTQRFPGFEPNMAAVDALFNVGKFPE